MVRQKRQSSKSKVDKKSPVIWHRHGLRIVHHKHSGSLLPWHYTSYAILYFLLLFTAFLILFTSHAVKANHETAQGSIMLGATVNGPPPSEPAVITLPANNSRVQNSLLNVAGDCTQNLFIEVYRNNSFAGMDLCDGNDRFEISITLVPGENILKARIKDGAEQYGPDSKLITVFYDAPVSKQGGSKPPVSPTTVPPFLLYTSQALYGVSSGVKFTITYEVDGGLPPYAVSIDWGDGTSQTVTSISKNGDYISDHIYLYGGQFTIRISGSDSRNTKAVIQTIIIVQDSGIAKTVVTSDCSGQQNCLSPNQYLTDIVNRYLWPATIVALLMTVSFWVGERIVYSERNHTNKLKHTTS